MPTPPAAPGDEASLEALLSRPTDGVLDTLRRHPGDLVILGAGGKMGPTLATMARRAMDTLGRRDRVVAVSRFREPAPRDRLRAAGVETVAADLLDRGQVRDLPDAAALVFMAGQKFGTAASPAVTWAMNALLPALAAERYPGVPTVVFSTGNVYPLTPVTGPGPAEGDPVGPVGEYAMSCLARERIFEYAALSRGTPVVLLRLNYAIDLRYGVLLDLARRIRDGDPVPLEMGYVNLIWQGDANARALQSLDLASAPATVLNLTGPATPVRRLAELLGQRLGRPAVFQGVEGRDALLSDPAESIRRFGAPEVKLDTMIAWTVEWLRRGGPLLHKPTRFEVRDGRF